MLLLSRTVTVHYMERLPQPRMGFQPLLQMVMPPRLHGRLQSATGSQELA